MLSFKEVRFTKLNMIFLILRGKYFEDLKSGPPNRNIIFWKGEKWQTLFGNFVFSQVSLSDTARYETQGTRPKRLSMAAQ